MSNLRRKRWSPPLLCTVPTCCCCPRGRERGGSRFSPCLRNCYSVRRGQRKYSYLDPSASRMAHTADHSSTPSSQNPLCTSILHGLRASLGLQGNWGGGIVAWEELQNNQQAIIISFVMRLLVTAQWSSCHAHFIDEETKGVFLTQDHRTGNGGGAQETRVIWFQINCYRVSLPSTWVWPAHLVGCQLQLPMKDLSGRLVWLYPEWLMLPQCLLQVFVVAQWKAATYMFGSLECFHILKWWRKSLIMELLRKTNE